MSPGRVVVSIPRLGASFRLDTRLLRVSAIAAAVTFALFCTCLAVGDFGIWPWEAALALFGLGPEGSGFVVYELRLPRALVGGLAGAALALSGTIFQTMVRNPLASPDIIGITSGATVAGVAMFLSGGSTASLPIAAFGGAMASALILYVLAWRGGLSPNRLVLVGIGLAAFGFAVTSFLLVRDRIEEVAQATIWMVGSVNNRLYSDVVPLAIGMGLLIPLLGTLSRALDSLALGEESARTLGVPVERTRFGLVMLGAAFVALAIAAAGPIAFVALIAPNIARRLVPNAGASILPLSALCGACLVLASDIASRVVFGESQFPVGVVTAFVGAPFFLYQLRIMNRIRTAA